MFSLCDKIRLHRQMISRGSYFATKQNFILSILLFKSRVKWILYSCWKWGDNYYNQHKSEHLENECKIKPRKQLKKKKQESRMNEKWSLQMYRWTQNKFFSCFHSDLSMNNITELPAYVFKTFPYLEELWVHAPSKWCIYSVQCWHEGWSLWYAPGYFSLHCKVHRACPSS